MVIEQGGNNLSSSRSRSDTIDSMIDCCYFLVAEWFPKGEMAEE